MPLAIYVKENTAKLQKLRKRRDRTFFGFITLLGISSIIFSIWPYISWQLITLPKFTGKIENLPVPQGQVLSSASILEDNVQVVEDQDGFSYFTTDFKPEGIRPSQFSLSIPKLKVKDAKVKVDSLNFYDNLALFPGTAIPGEIGNSFITGHSVLPSFYDPKNYKAIFTKLMDLEVGDDVYLNIEGKNLHFIVQYSKIVDPRDVSVLAPISANGRNLTLMTCVPPGTSTKRLIVITSLI